ncbi:MAG TPA: hypothetical protein VFL57_16930 [Bryobacteraceae bacterium]|nr:hypothetical protein [Bryobacteraceae bacterium]
MLVVRDIFIAKPGMASKLARVLCDAVSGGPDRVRVMTDLVGQFNNVVMETEVDSLQRFEQRMQDYRTDEQIRTKMAGYTELYAEGRREIFEVVGGTGGRVR